MGIVSFFVICCGFAALVVLLVKTIQRHGEETDRFTRSLLLVALLMLAAAAFGGALGTVNAYFVKIDTPLDAPAADLPEKAPPAARQERPEIKPVEKPSPMKEARGEHREALYEFEQENSRAEQRSPVPQ